MKQILLIVGGLGFVGLVGILLMTAMLGFSSGPDSPGENPSLATSSGGNGASDAGKVSDEIPKLLSDLFAQASKETGTTTPVALLAAISNQECGMLWGYTQNHQDEIRDLINSGGDVAYVPEELTDEQSRAHPNGWGCGYSNTSRVWGPMQFLDTTFGIPRGANAKTHPAPRAAGFGALASKFLKKSPAIPGSTMVSMLSIKDSVYASSIKLYTDAGKPAVWDESRVRTTAARYYGSCTGRHAFYCESIVRKWQKYSLPEGTP